MVIYLVFIFLGRVDSFIKHFLKVFFYQKSGRGLITSIFFLQNMFELHGLDQKHFAKAAINSHIDKTQYMFDKKMFNLENKEIYAFVVI